MNYTKPEVAVLGDATVVIEQTISKANPVVPDGTGGKHLNPAYDLDE
jgi:hypothetical protein